MINSGFTERARREPSPFLKHVRCDALSLCMADGSASRIVETTKLAEGIKHFIAYKILFQPHLAPEGACRRRFNDFVWLHSQLRAKHKGMRVRMCLYHAQCGLCCSFVAYLCINANYILRAGVFVPPLPERDDFVWDKFNQAFVETRRRALEIFLHRIVAHPLLVRPHARTHARTRTHTLNTQTYRPQYQA